MTDAMLIITGILFFALGFWVGRTTTKLHHREDMRQAELWGYVRGCDASQSFWEPRWSWLSQQCSELLRTSIKCRERVSELESQVDDADWWKQSGAHND